MKKSPTLKSCRGKGIAQKGYELRDLTFYDF